MTKSEYKAQVALGTLPPRLFHVHLLYKDGVRIGWFPYTGINRVDAIAQFKESLRVWNNTPMAMFRKGTIAFGPPWMVIRALKHRTGEYTLRVSRVRK